MSRTDINQPRREHERYGPLSLRVYRGCTMFIASSRTFGPGAGVPSSEPTHIFIWNRNGRLPGLRPGQEVRIATYNAISASHT